MEKRDIFQVLHSKSTVKSTRGRTNAMTEVKRDDKYRKVHTCLQKRYLTDGDSAYTICSVSGEELILSRIFDHVARKRTEWPYGQPGQMPKLATFVALLIERKL